MLATWEHGIWERNGHAPEEEKFLLYCDVKTGNTTRSPVYKKICGMKRYGNLLAMTTPCGPGASEVWIWDIEKRSLLHHTGSIRTEYIIYSTWAQESYLFLDAVGDPHESLSFLLTAYSVEEDGRDVQQQFTKEIGNYIVGDTRFFEGLPRGNGLLVKDDVSASVLSMLWKVPTLVDLCREALEQDPDKAKWPAEVAEIVYEEWMD